MLPEIFYLAPTPQFKYTAIVPWPWTILSPQSDWIDSMFTLEVWLNTRVGLQDEQWAYAPQAGLEFTRACIAFRRERDKTLFLLTWS
jgi:hypothetical protein